MLALGFWQLDRAEQKRERLALIEQRSNLAPLRIDDLHDGFDDIRDLPLTVSGNFDQSEYYLLDNRVYEGNVGYQVIGKLHTSYGVLFVNLGWVEGTGSRDQLPTIALPDRSILLSGVVAVPELNPWIKETASASPNWPKLIQQLDLELLQSWQPNQRLLDFVLLVNPQQPIGFARNWQPVVMPPEKHTGYALQWFGLSLAALIVFIVVMRKHLSGAKHLEAKK